MPFYRPKNILLIQIRYKLWPFFSSKMFQNVQQWPHSDLKVIWKCLNWRVWSLKKFQKCTKKMSIQTTVIHWQYFANFGGKSVEIEFYWNLKRIGNLKLDLIFHFDLWYFYIFKAWVVSEFLVNIWLGQFFTFSVNGQDYSVFIAAWNQEKAFTTFLTGCGTNNAYQTAPILKIVTFFHPKAIIHTHM